MAESDDPLDQPEEDANGWLVSYADMITLIACFFILMMAFANFEPVGFQRKAEELSKSFRKDKYKSSHEKAKFLEEEIAKHPVLPKKVKISVKDDIMKVVFSGSTIFKNGEWVLEGETLKTVDSLIDILKTTNPHFRILVEGHADDDLSDSPIKSSWGLSGLRAASIIERFEFFGFPRNNITAVSKGDTQPLVNSIDKKGKRIEKLAMMNRRAVIMVLEPIEKKKVKLGLGVYFQDSTSDNAEGFRDVEQFKQDNPQD
jgi:chemotaxis protein MotB